MTLTMFILVACAVCLLDGKRSACRKSVFDKLSKFSELQKSSENL